MGIRNYCRTPGCLADRTISGEEMRAIFRNFHEEIAFCEKNLEPEQLQKYQKEAKTWVTQTCRRTYPEYHLNLFRELRAVMEEKNGGIKATEEAKDFYRSNQWILDKTEKRYSQSESLTKGLWIVAFSVVTVAAGFWIPLLTGATAVHGGLLFQGGDRDHVRTQRPFL